MYMRTRKAHNKFSTERTEVLMLMAVLAETGVRHEALAELKRRRDVGQPDPMPDAYCTNIGIIPC